MLTFLDALKIDDIRTDAAEPNLDKASKESVSYTDDSSSPTDRCALCEHWEHGACVLVEGEIAPGGWCELFEPEGKWAERHCTRSEMARTGDPLVDFILQMPVTSRNIDSPIIDRSKPTPYGAGGSVPLENPVTFIDPSVPDTLKASGVTYDPAEPWLIHENVEQRAMDLLIAAGVPNEMAYRFAHFEIANVAENAWKKYHGIDPKDADAVEEPILDAIQHTLIDAHTANPQLYLEPYPDEDEAAARHEHLQESPPTPEEIAECRAILCAVLGLDDGERQLPVKQQSLEKQEWYVGMPHGCGGPPMFTGIVKQQPSVSDVHATTALGNNRRRKLKPLWKDPRKMNARSFDELMSFYASAQGKAADMISTAYFPGMSKANGDVGLSVPLLLRLLEWAREDAPDDLALHRAAEKMLEQGSGMDMSHYDKLVSKVWASNADLPQGVKGLPSEAQSVFRRVANDRMKAGHSEVSAIRQAWTAVKNGWKKSGDKWVRKSEDGFCFNMTVAKADADRQHIYGWASVSTVNGEHVVDKQGDVIPVDEIEKAAYEFVQFSRDMGDMHRAIGVGRMIESCVFTAEKAACGIAAKNENGQPIEGWWVGFHVIDPASWKAIKAGERPELSIGGRATWEDS